MANTPRKLDEERFMICALDAVEPGARDGHTLVQRVAQAICDAEQRGREAERAEVVNYLRQPEHDAADLAHNIESGKHLVKGGE